MPAHAFATRIMFATRRSVLRTFSMHARLAATRGRNVDPDPDPARRPSCVLPVSVGWPKHQHDYMAATLALVQTSFRSCRIVVCDTLQVHMMRYMDTLTTTGAIQIAKDRGSEWIRTYAPFVQSMTIPVQWSRWDAYTSDPLVHDARTRLELELEMDSALKDSLAKTICAKYNSFVRAGVITPTPESTIVPSLFMECEMRHLMEECAVVLTWDRCRFRETVLLYPTRLGIFEMDVMNRFWGSDRDFLQPMQIRFKHL